MKISSPLIPVPHEGSPTVLLVLHPQDHLGGTVVPGHHVGGHHEVGASCPGQSKVQDLQGAVGLHHYVAGLEVLPTTNRHEKAMAEVFFFRNLIELFLWRGMLYVNSSLINGDVFMI